MMLSLTHPRANAAEYDRNQRLSRTIMHDPIHSFLARRPMLVLDGAMATEEIRSVKRCLHPELAL